jgi:AraC-like DNA-binding protein
VQRSEAKADVTSSLSTLLTDLRDGEVTRSTDFGTFQSSVENLDQDLMMVRREFTTSGEPLTIPFTRSEPSLQMIFSLDGRSVLNNKFDPYILSPLSHSLNLFNGYDCRNILEGKARQHDLAFGLKKKMVTDIMGHYLAAAEDRLPSMIFQQQEFNTLNDHIPADAAIIGIIRNILECPFQNEMRIAFIREHVRALLMLQLFHFSPIVTGKMLHLDRKISRRDDELLHEVKKYLDENFLDASSLEGLTKQFGLNEFKLKHGFKKLFNTSPMRYMQQKRLEYALMLLRDSDRTIKSIAGEIGYTHAANFTIAFSKAFGASPLHYRAGKK